MPTGETPGKQLEKYYRKDPEVTNATILRFLRDSPDQMIVHGTRAINAQLPDWLDKETKDWDILVEGKAEELAKQLEKKLDARYSADFFDVKPAKHPGTFKVYSKVSGDEVADITLRDRKVEFKEIEGVDYATLEDQEQILTTILDDPSQEFRHAKDRDKIQRIDTYRKVKKRRKQRRKEREDDPFPAFRGLR